MTKEHLHLSVEFTSPCHSPKLVPCVLNPQFAFFSLILCLPASPSSQRPDDISEFPSVFLIAELLWVLP